MNGRICCAMTAASILLASGAEATVRRVPSQYATIYQALDASVTGDSVLVAPGTYTATVTRVVGSITYRAAGFLKTGVTLVSEGGSASTTINVTSTGSNVHCLAAPASLSGSTPARVIGFTLRKPSASSAAILASNNAASSQLEVWRCLFMAIPGGSQAGGIYVTSGSVRVESCTFVQCSGIAAGGVASSSTTAGAEAILTDTMFQACESTTNGGGATIATQFARLSGCSFTTCHGEIGGGLSSTSMDLGVDACRFVDNLADAAGGGFYWAASPGEGWLRGSLFLRNEARGSGRGGGLFWELVRGELVSNTFVGNISTVEQSFTGTSAARLHTIDVTIRNNIFSGNRGELAVRVTDTAYPFEEDCNVYWDNPLGNFNVATGPHSQIADPQFCNEASSNFLVHESSPCAEANSLGCGHIGAFKPGCDGFHVIVNTEPPEDMVLILDGIARVMPYYADSLEWAPGTQHVLQAPPTQVGDPESATYWEFIGWSDFGDTTHVITVPAEPVRYTAKYLPKPKTRVELRAAPDVSLDLLADGVLANGYSYWIPGSTHTLEAVSPQPAATGYEWVFANWNDGGARVHDVIAPPTFTSYVATFANQHADGLLLLSNPSGRKLQVDADTVLTPRFYSPQQWPPGSPRTVRALTPQDVAGTTFTYAFDSWSDGGDTTHVFVPPPGPFDLTANYSLESKRTFQVVSDPVGRTVILDGQSATTPTTVAWSRGTTHTIGVNSPQPGAPGIEYRFLAWSDSGAVFHSILVGQEGMTLSALFATDSLPGIVLRTVPSGLRVKADGVFYTTPKYLPWTQGSNHTIVADSTQDLAGVPYLFDQWEDSTSVRTRVIVQPAGQANVTATYSPNYFTAVTIQTSPTNLPLRADDVPYHTPATLLWRAGTSHTVELDSLVDGVTGTRYRFKNWNDSATLPRTRTINAPSAPTTYTGTYVTQYLLTMNADPGGTVTPPTGFQDTAVALQIRATPSPGSLFRDWVGSGVGSYTGTQNPRTITLGGPVTETARFIDVAFEFSLSLSDTDPHVHSGAPIGTGPVHLWLVCGSGMGATRFQARPSGDLQSFQFQAATGVFDAGVGGDIDLLFSCAQGPMRLGQFFVLDPAGGELCLAPSQSFGRLAAIDCTGPPDVVYAWPEDLHIDGIATNGAVPCASGRSCVTPSPVLPMDFVSNLAAAEVERAVEVRWSTSGEVLADGFRVYRSDRASGGFHSLHEGLVHGTSAFVWRDATVLPQTTYFYLLGAFDGEGREQRVGPVSVQTDALRPLEFAFDTVHPNPFMHRTELDFMIPASSRVICSVYDVSGRLLGTILDATYPAGEHRVAWEGRDLSGRRMAAGVYFLRLQAGPSASTRKVVMLEGN